MQASPGKFMKSNLEAGNANRQCMLTGCMCDAKSEMSTHLRSVDTFMTQPIDLPKRVGPLHLETNEAAEHLMTQVRRCTRQRKMHATGLWCK